MPTQPLAIPMIPPNTAAGPQLVSSINDRIRKLQIAIATSAAKSSVQYGTHAARLNATPSANAGVLWTEIDRGYLLYFSDGTSWHFVAGTYSGGWAQRPVGLRATDAGLQFFISMKSSTYPWYGWTEMWSGSAWLYVSGEGQLAYSAITTLGGLLGASEINLIVAESTYLHRYVWTGAAFTYANGDSSQYFVEAPSTPPGGMWYPCDGSVHACSTAIGVGTVNVATQAINTGSPVLLASGGFAATAVATQVNSGSSFGIFTVSKFLRA